MKGFFNLENKVAILTGASKGIGASMAKAFASHGASVVVSSRKQEAVDEVAAAINKAGGKAIGVACHVGHKDQLEQLVEKTISDYGGVDILVNNAATNPVYGPLADSDECMSLANLCYPSMSKRGGGSIINIASVEGLKPSPGLGLYSVSKAALIMLTKSQAKEWGSNNIRSNAICPGLVKTKFSQALWTDEENLKKFVKYIPMKRMAEPDEMVGLALYLASDSASYTTGGVYTSDGGYMLS